MSGPRRSFNGLTVIVCLLNVAALTLEFLALIDQRLEAEWAAGGREENQARKCWQREPALFRQSCRWAGQLGMLTF